MACRWTFRDIRGETLQLYPPHYYLYGTSGTGIAKTVHLTQVGAYQDGVVEAHARRDPRVMQFAFDVIADTWAELPTLRDELYFMFADAYNGCYAHALREDGSEREILARLIGALDMPLTAGQDGLCHQRVVLSLQANDPNFYDPNATTWVYELGAGSSSWAYSLGFSAGFGAATIDLTEVRPYFGHHKGWPIITVTGPADGLIIENETTDELLDLDDKSYDIAASEVVTFDLRPRYKTIESSTDGDILEYLSDDSDLGTFHLAPHPEANGGLNQMHIECSSATNETQIVVQFNTQYAGV